MFDLNSYLTEKRILIDDALYKILNNLSDSDRLLKAMNYSVMAGGKRIRPILCLAAFEAVAGNAKDALPAACALEMIHTYSLIHDDLPAMDNDKLRRGKPTCHIMFDETTAILAGDALLTLAFQILSSAGLTVKNKNASKWLNVIYSISMAAGYKGMIEGQMQDIDSENKFIVLDKLKQMHLLKTGALIRASINSGVILGGGPPRQLKQLDIYAKNIGLAFQVTDDILNVEGNPTLMGKAVGTDITRKKSTYPSIMGIKKSKEFAKKLVDSALKALDYFNTGAEPLYAIGLYIIERKR